MTCNCDNDESNEYIIELNQQGAPGVRGEKGEQGYSPTVSYISDSSGLVINIVNEQDTISTPVIPLKSYVDTASDTKMNTDGSNAASSVRFNNIYFSYVGTTKQTIRTANSQELLIAGQGLYLQGHASQAQGYPNSITIAPRGTSIKIGNTDKHSIVVDNDGASYDGNEIATVNQIPSLTSKLNTDGSNATNNFTVNGVELAGNYVYMNSVSSGGISVTQSNSDIFAKLQVDSSIAQLRMPGLYLNSGATGNITLNTTRDIVINSSNTSNKIYYHGTSANNEVAIKGDIPTYYGGEGITISSDNYIWLDYNSNKGLDVPEFSNSLAIKTDGDTISFDSDGALTIAPSLLASYVTNTSLATTLADYALISDIPDISTKQDILVSGTNIKTINNQSILGSGNIDVQGGTSYTAGTGIDITNDTISVDNTVLTTNTAQTITEDKTFSADIHLDGGNIRLDKTTSHIQGKDINNNYRNIIARSVNSSDITIGNQGDVLRFAGKLSYPKYNNVDMALLTDIPTVNNSTITFTQGGVTKGTITLNQSSNQTIALDAGGGGGGATIDDTTPSTTTVYSSQKVQDLIDALTVRIMALEANINGGNA